MLVAAIFSWFSEKKLDDFYTSDQGGRGFLKSFGGGVATPITPSPPPESALAPYNWLICCMELVYHGEKTDECRNGEDFAGQRFCYTWRRDAKEMRNTYKEVSQLGRDFQL